MLKRTIRTAEQSFLLWRGTRRFRGALINGEISLEALAEIWLGWGNTAFSASPDVLFELASLSLTVSDRPVVEFGGGISTLVLGLVAERTGNRVVTIESDEGWCTRLNSILIKHGITRFDIRCRPLVHYSEYDWYEIGSIADLTPTGLVFCDGPPGNTRGGRRGILERFAPFVGDSCTVVIDDTNRQPERDLSIQWAAEQSCVRQTFQGHSARAFDVLCHVHSTPMAMQ